MKVWKSNSNVGMVWYGLVWYGPVVYVVSILIYESAKKTATLQYMYVANASFSKVSFPSY